MLLSCDSDLLTALPQRQPFLLLSTLRRSSWTSARKKSFTEQPARPEDAHAQAQAQEDAQAQDEAHEDAHDEAQEE